MFFSAAQIAESLDRIEPLHQFFGTSFLAFKLAELPVGTEVRVRIAKLEKEILDRYYQPVRDSDYYYVPFRGSGRKNRWVNRRYQDTTLQRIRVDTFGHALIHEKNSQNWGWRPEYISALRAHLDDAIPAFHLAVWLYRQRDWPGGSDQEAVIRALFAEFHVSEPELELFDRSIPASLVVPAVFAEGPISEGELQDIVGLPPDAPPIGGGVLRELELRGVGPAKRLCLDPAERLNIITGDNGLGKTFLMECVWWALSGDWAELAAYPRSDATGHAPRITFRVSGQSARLESRAVDYDWDSQSWPSPQVPAGSGLLLYARVDGSFAVWDPAKTFGPRADSWMQSLVPKHGLVFSREQVWDGLAAEGPGGQTHYLCNGLLRDWAMWQSKPQRYPFEVFRAVVRRLSPPEFGSLEMGEPSRITSADTREIPTLRLPYGQVPVVHVSAGMRRIITLAYLLVWAWEEHRIASELIRKPPQKKMVVLIDEMEAHLHPQWQRSIVPALFDVIGLLSGELQVQLFIGTHSPLVMASIEPLFDDSRDQLFNLKLEQQNVVLEPMQYIRHGPVDAWLTSEVFGLTSARSLEAEAAIGDAKNLQTQHQVKQEDVKAVTDRLIRLLSAYDEFWPRWKHFAEQHGVSL